MNTDTATESPAASTAQEKGLGVPRLVRGWRCFHCDEVFEDAESAERHFGPSECSEPECRISREKFEALQFEVDRYREEDGPKDREMAIMRCKHSQALREAEEEGYFKGLQDGKNLPANDERTRSPGDAPG